MFGATREQLIKRYEDEWKTKVPEMVAPSLRRRLKAVRAALRKLSKLEWIDPHDAADVLAADDRLRKRLQ